MGIQQDYSSSGFLQDVTVNVVHLINGRGLLPRVNDPGDKTTL